MPGVGHVGQVDEEVVAEHPFPVSEYAVLAATVIGAEHPHAADQYRHLGGGQTQELGTIKHQLLRGNHIVCLEPVAVAVVDGFQRFE